MLKPGPLRVALLCSQRAPGLRALLRAGPAAPYRIVGVVTSDPASAVLADTAGTGVPCVVRDIRMFYRERRARLTDLSWRPEYDGGLLQSLAPFRPDLIVLCGYLHILTDPFLSAYRGRVVNVHDSDLSLAGNDERPRYRGLRSTRDALVAGERETRSTVHVVTDEVDVGPVLVRSWAFPVSPLVEDARRWQAGDLLKVYAYVQREWMMRASWGRLLDEALRLFAADAVRVLGRQAYVAGFPGPMTLERPATLPPAPSHALPAGR